MPGELQDLNPGITLAVLRQLLAVQTRGSLGGAARELGVSQPTVSSNLARLEETIGIPLFLRGGRGTSLTREGELVAAAARSVLEAAGDLARVIKDLPRMNKTPLRIAASLTIAEQLVPRWLADRAIARLIQPGQFALSVGNSEEVMAWILHEEADLGFVEGIRFAPGLAHTPVGHDELVVVVGAAHRWFGARSSVSPSELGGAGLVLRERGSGTREVLEVALAAKGVQLPHDLPSFGSTAAILTAVKYGGAAAVVSRLAVEDRLETGELTAIEVSDLDLTRNFYAVWRDGVPPRADAAGLIANVARRWRRYDDRPAGAVNRTP